MKKIKAKGVKIIFLTLHVGVGTFLPVKTEQIEKHKLHREHFEINKKALAEIIKAKKERRSIIAVGTTSARVLETVFANRSPRVDKIRDTTDIFIYPGYKFKLIDGLITNFHLPKSSLIMLVSAFAGDKRAGVRLIRRAYQEAIGRKYRFFSYGDAMLIR